MKENISRLHMSLFTMVIMMCTIGFVHTQSITLNWAKDIKGNSDEVGEDIAVDNIGNVYVTGVFSGTADFDPGPGIQNLTSTGNEDIFFAKYDPSGNYIYAKAIGAVSSDRGLRIAVDAAGNIYITGYFQETADFDPGPSIHNLTSMGGSDVFFAKYDVSGNYIYAKNVGGITDDVGTALAVIAISSDVYLIGFFANTVDFDPGAGIQNLSSSGGLDIFFARYDASGNYVYAKSIGGVDDDYGYAIAVDNLSNIYITGSFQNTADFDPGAGMQNLISMSGKDGFFAKYNASGNYVYAQIISGGGNQEGMSIAVDPSGNNTYVSGYLMGTADFDPGSGTQNLTSTSAGGEPFFAKYDASGNYVYAKGLDGSSLDGDAYSIAVDPSGSVYIAGYFGTTIDFDPGVGTENLTSSGSYDVFFAKYDISGNYIYAKNVGGSGDDQNRGGIAINNGCIYITGYYQGTADFDPGPGTANLTVAGAADSFFAKYCEGKSSAIEDNLSTVDIKIYPNPTSSVVYVYIPSIAENQYELQLINMQGQVLLSQTLTVQNNMLNISSLPDGMYIIRINNNQGDISKKILVNH